MPLHKYTIVPPLVTLAGDTFDILAGVLLHRRGGNVIGTRILSQMESVPITQDKFGGNTVTHLYVEVPNMAALISTVESVVYNPDGSGIINYSDSTSEEFGSRQQLLDSVGDVNQAMARMLLKKAWLLRSPDGSNPAWITGKTIQIDMSLDMAQLQIGTVQ